MNTAEIRNLAKGTALTWTYKTRSHTRSKSCTYVTTRTEQSSPGRYYTMAVVIMDGREASVSVTSLTLA